MSYKNRNPRDVDTSGRNVGPTSQSGIWYPIM